MEMDSHWSRGCIVYSEGEGCSAGSLTEVGGNLFVEQYLLSFERFMFSPNGSFRVNGLYRIT